MRPELWSGDGRSGLNAGRRAALRPWPVCRGCVMDIEALDPESQMLLRVQLISAVA